MKISILSFNDRRACRSHKCSAKSATMTLVLTIVVDADGNPMILISTIVMGAEKDLMIKFICFYI